MTRIVLTRPVHAAQESASRLAAMGHEPIVLPMTQILPLATEFDVGTDAVDAVAITSANAVRHASVTLTEMLSETPAFAVGPRTAEATRAHGFRDVMAAGGDAERLVKTIRSHVPPGKTVLIMCGLVRRSVLEKGLLEAGYPIRIVETYDAKPVSWTESELSKRLAGDDPRAVFLYSVQAASCFSDLMERPFMRAKLGDARFYCLSARIADAVRGVREEALRIALEPSEDALIEIFEQGT